MRWLRRLPVRVSLTLWAAGILGIALLLLGIAVRVTVRSYLMTSIDNELASRAGVLQNRFFNMPPGFPGPPPGRAWRFDQRPPSLEREGRRHGGPFTPDWLNVDGIVFEPYNPERFRIDIPGLPWNGGRDGRGFGQEEKEDPYAPRMFDATGKPQRPRTISLDATSLKIVVDNHRVVFATVDYQGERLRVCSLPVIRNERLEGVIQLASRLTDIERGFAAVDSTLLMLLPLALLVTMFGGVLLTNRAIRPIEQSLEQERRFVADASHELRTPIAIILAAAELGREAAVEEIRPNSPVNRALDRISTAGARTQRIVEDLMLLARAESSATAGTPTRSTLALTLEPTLASDLLTEATTLFEPLREDRILSVDVSPPNLMILADRHHLGRVISNLLDNAVRHTSPRTGNIILSGRPAAGGMVLLQVTDNGEGIPAVDQPHLFRRFYRVDASRVRSRGGAGLGLSIAKAVVEAHQGSIQIESTPGSGTTVSLLVPVAKKPLN